MKNKMLFDTLWMDTKVKLEESENGVKKYIISGPFMKADSPNGNNRIYPKDVCDKAIDKLRPKVMDKQIRMLVDHPFWEGAKLSDAGALLLEISNIQPDGYAYYKAQVLDTTKGKDLKVIMDAGGKIGCSTRGYGTSSDDQEWEGFPGRYSVIRDDYELKSIDFVDDPSVSETTMLAQYESLKKGSLKMKTLEELKAAYPELIKQLEESNQAIIDEKTEAITVLENTNAELNQKLQSIVNSLKESFGDMFTVVEESKLVDSKNDKINELTKEIDVLKAELADSKKEIKTMKDEAVIALKDAEIEKLKLEDKEFFNINIFENVFEACVTAEEVKEVYEKNKAVVESIKKQNNLPAKPKTTVEDKNDTDSKSSLDEANLRKMAIINKQRRISGLKMFTVKEYTEKYINKD